MFARAPLSWGQLLAVLLIGVVIVYLLVAALSPGYVSDIGTNKVWGRQIAREGIYNIYRISTDYPPVLLYFFGAAAEIYERFVDPTFSEKTMLASQLYTFLIKLPGIIFHPIVASAVYLLESGVRYVSHFSKNTEERPLSGNGHINAASRASHRFLKKT